MFICLWDTLTDGHHNCVMFKSTTGCSIKKNIRLIFLSFLTQLLTSFNNSFTAAFSDELHKKME